MYSPKVFQYSTKNKQVLLKPLCAVSVSAIGNKNVSSDKDSLELIRSWTTFTKSASSVKTHKAILEYIGVVPLSLEDKVCKW